MLELKATANHFASTRTAMCAFFLTGSRAELEALDKVTLFAGASKDYHGKLIADHAAGFGYVILDFEARVPLAFLEDDGRGWTHVGAILTPKGGAPYWLNLPSSAVASDTMPRLPAAVPSNSVAVAPQHVWPVVGGVRDADRQVFTLRDIDAADRTYWAASVTIDNGNARGYIGAQRLAAETGQDAAIFSLWNARHIADDAESNAHAVFNAAMESASTPGFSCIARFPKTYRSQQQLEVSVRRVTVTNAVVAAQQPDGTYSLVRADVRGNDRIAWFRGEVGGQYVATIGVDAPASAATASPRITDNFVEVFDFFKPKKQSIVTYSPPLSAVAGASPVTIAYLYDTDPIGSTISGVTHAGGAFRREAPGVWVELDRNLQPAFTFTELRRDQWTVMLYDRSRSVRIVLDLRGNAILFAFGSERPWKLYEIQWTW